MARKDNELDDRGATARATGLVGSGGDDYLTISEVARWLRISRGGAWAMVMERREIPHVRLSDRVVRIARADVEEFVASRRVEAAR